jgi:hypothetical protein
VPRDIDLWISYGKMGTSGVYRCTFRG